MTASILDITGAPKASRAPDSPPRLDMQRRVAFFNAQKLPAILRADALGCTARTLLGSHRDEWLALLRKYGALLLRGFTVAGADELRELAALCSGGSETTPGATPGARPGDGMSPGAVAVAAATALPHNTQADRSRHPNLLLFFHETPAAQGGEAILADTRAIYRHIDADVRTEFERRGLLYRRHFTGEPPRGVAALAARRGLGHAPPTWQEVFGTDSRAGAEATCKAQELSIEWDETDGSATVSNRLPATRVHPATSETLWFNHVLQAARLGPRRQRRPLGVLFGDGGPIPRKHLRHIAAVQRRLSAPLPWQQGDLLLVDNLLTCHGCRPHRGKRNVLTATA